MKKDMDKLFDKVSDETAGRIADEYPTGDKKQRDRIYKEVKRRVEGDYSAAGDEVRGVEAYRPRPYLRIVSAAAAFVLVAGAVGGGYALLNKKGGSPAKTVPASEAGETVEPAEESTEITVPVAEEPAKVVPELLTKDELIEKINNRSYDDYDQLTIKYTYTMSNGASTEYGIASRDSITGNESLTKTWTHTADYFGDELIATYGLDTLMKEENTCNEMFFYKDLYICIYSNGTDAPHQYEVTDRSNWTLDDPNVFRNLFSEYIAVDLDLYNIDDNTSSTVYLGRPCTEARIYAGTEELQERLEKKYSLGHPEAITEPGDSDIDKLQEIFITVDNETGFILKAVPTVDNYSEEFAVEEMLFNEDAELVPDGAYIKKRLEGCIPVSDMTAAYDLSILDEDTALPAEGEEITPAEDENVNTVSSDNTEYNVNSKGQTYGGAGYIIAEENIDKLPDYIGIGINGGKGNTYLNTKELIDTFVDCEAAFDMQEILNNISDTAVAVDVNIYDEEGNFLRTLTFYTEPENLK